MKRIFTLSLLALFALGFSSLQAVTYTVNQSIDFVGPKQCFGPLTPVVNGQDLVDLVSVDVHVDHNINGYPVGSPFLPATINNQCWRYLYFDIYKYNNGLETYEATITKYHYWLHGAAYTNGSSTNTYTLSVNDLNNAGISGGKKIVRLRVKYDYFGNTPHTLNLNVSSNGNALCSQNNIDYSANSPLTCNVGLIDCFTYHPCDADLTVFGYVSLVPQYDRFGNFIGYTKQYTYPVNISGGSGNFTYSWTSNDVPNTSSGTSFVFQYSGNNPHVNLTVTDNVTGCVYFWSTNGKNSVEPEVESAEFGFAPNPVASNSSLRVNFSLTSPDRVNFELYDLSGKMVKTLGHSVEGFMGDNSTEISTSDISPGIYFVRMLSSQNGTHTQKLVVQ